MRQFFVAVPGNMRHNTAMNDGKRPLPPGAASRIRELRDARGWSMADLAARMGTGASTINKLEKGRPQLTIAWLARLAAAFGIRPGDLLAEQPEELPAALEAAPLAARLPASPPGPVSDFSRRRVPVFGVAAGGDDGRFLFNGEMVDTTFCPP